AGAYSHALWRLRTDTGDYAVKIFDRTVDHTLGDDFTDRMAEPVAIELAAITAGINAPQPIPATDGTYIHAVDGTLARVHTWADAEPATGEPDPPFAAHVGRALAAVHRLPVTCPHQHAEGLWTTHDDAHITALADRAKAAGEPWAADLDRARRAWRTVRELARSRRSRTWPLISTHRDLGPKNVLRDVEGRPVIVDWDVAGPWTAPEELAAASVEWAGVKTGPPDRAAVAALVEGYRAEGGEVTVDGPEVFASWLVKNANWTEMHIRHALDPTAPRRERSRLAVPGLLPELSAYAAGVEEWTRWLSS
ncbi:MAG TPA: phosphotransferase, partial [Phytomonospora sp.]